MLHISVSVPSQDLDFQHHISLFFCIQWAPSNWETIVWLILVELKTIISFLFIMPLFSIWRNWWPICLQIANAPENIQPWTKLFIAIGMNYLIKKKEIPVTQIINVSFFFSVQCIWFYFDKIKLPTLMEGYELDRYW